MLQYSAAMQGFNLGGGRVSLCTGPFHISTYVCKCFLGYWIVKMGIYSPVLWKCHFQRTYENVPFIVGLSLFDHSCSCFWENCTIQNWQPPTKKNRKKALRRKPKLFDKTVNHVEHYFGRDCKLWKRYA